MDKSGHVLVQRQTLSDLLACVKATIEYKETNGAYPAHEIGLEAEINYLLRKNLCGE
jgi:hypothetical protein